MKKVFAYSAVFIIWLFQASAEARKLRCIYELPENYKTLEVDAPGCIHPRVLISEIHFCEVHAKRRYQLTCIQGENYLSAEAKYYFDCFESEYSRGSWSKKGEKWFCK